MNDPQSVGSALATRRGGDIEARLNTHVGWLDTISPSHMPARQLVALAVAELRKDARLADAAEANPGSFMVAVAECARLGLVPGDKYWLTGFNDKTAPGGMRVVGMVGYQGAMELAYRTGEVESIHCEVVRAKDFFKWRPTQMRVPEHVIVKNEYGQEGLADQGERGPLTAVYAYARMKDGGISQCVVMPKSEVIKHRDVAKNDKFWGPPWPKEGPWTPAMWEKTGILSLADYLPDSPEYMKAKLAQQTRIAETPVPPDIAEAQARQQERESAEAPDLGNTGPAPVTIAGQVERNERGQARPEKRDDIVNGIGVLFNNAGLPIGDDRYNAARETLLLVMANPDGEPLELPSWNKLTNGQLITARRVLGDTIIRAKEAGQEPAEALLGIARRAGWQEEPDGQGEATPDETAGTHAI